MKIKKLTSTIIYEEPATQESVKHLSNDELKRAVEFFSILLEAKQENVTRVYANDKQN